jgi:hypothetical protein
MNFTRAFLATSIPRLIALLTCITCSPAADITFAGVMIVGESVHFILIDSESGRSSGWIQVGDTFERHKVSRYDRLEERLIVAVDERERPLKLIGNPNSGNRSTVVRVEDKEYQIFSDTKEQDGAKIVFRGNVTGISNGAHFSCDEVTVSSDRLMLVGSVKLQRPGSLLRAERLRLSR